MPLLNPSEVEAVRITLIRKLGGGVGTLSLFRLIQVVNALLESPDAVPPAPVEVPVVGSESSTETESPPAPEESAPVTIETPPPPPAVPSQEPTPPVPPAPAVTNGGVPSFAPPKPTP